MHNAWAKDTLFRRYSEAQAMLPSKKKGAPPSLKEKMKKGSDNIAARKYRTKQKKRTADLNKREELLTTKNLQLKQEVKTLEEQIEEQIEEVRQRALQTSSNNERPASEESGTPVTALDRVNYTYVLFLMGSVN